MLISHNAAFIRLRILKLLFRGTQCYAGAVSSPGVSPSELPIPRGHWGLSYCLLSAGGALEVSPSSLQCAASAAALSQRLQKYHFLAEIRSN